MAQINVQELITACDLVARRCTEIAETHHGSAWLFDKLMRSFESCDALEAITIPVYLNAPVMSKGEATIGRDGSLVMRRVGER